MFAHHVKISAVSERSKQGNISHIVTTLLKISPGILSLHENDISQVLCSPSASPSTILAFSAAADQPVLKSGFYEHKLTFTLYTIFTFMSYNIFDTTDSSMVLLYCFSSAGFNCIVEQSCLLSVLFSTFSSPGLHMHFHIDHDNRSTLKIGNRESNCLSTDGVDPESKLSYYSNRFLFDDNVRKSHNYNSLVPSAETT